MVTTLAPTIAAEEAARPQAPDPATEYVVPFGGLANAATALTQYLDDIQRDVGSRVYEQMQYDAEIAKCIELICISVLGDGVTLSPAVPESHPKYKKAQKITRFVGRSFTQYAETAPRTFFYEQLKGALTFGNKAGEITLKDGVGEDRDMLVLRSLKAKPRHSVAYVVTRMLDIIGLIGTQMPTNTPDELDLGLIGYDTVPSDRRLLVRRDKFSILSLRTMDGDPRGGSWLRPVYNAYSLKRRAFPEYLRWLMVCAIPTVVGVCAPDAGQTREPLVDGTSGKTVLRDGKTVEATPMQVMANRLAQYRNALAIAIPNGADVKKIEASSDGAPFSTAFDFLNGEIDTGLIFHPLVAREGRFMARAAQAGAMSVFDLLVYWLKMLMCETSVRDICRYLTVENFGEENEYLTPTAMMGDTERRDFSKDAMGVAQLAGVNWFADYTPAEREEVGRMVGLPARQNIPDAPVPDGSVQIVKPLPKPPAKSGTPGGQEGDGETNGGSQT